jgi:hypothetical protein
MSAGSKGDAPFGRAAEDARIALLSDLRRPPFRDADRDRGLERAWTERLSGTVLSDGPVRLALDRDGAYRARLPGWSQSGRWSVWSNVGRACVMLLPGDAEGYGFVITREAGRAVGLNGRPYAVESA